VLRLPPSSSHDLNCNQTVTTQFLLILTSLPAFGFVARDVWLWAMTISPGFLGAGMITGPTISLHMLFGACVGWEILSPIARHYAWAPGTVDYWENGSRGWILWVSLACLLADCVVKILWPLPKLMASLLFTVRRYDLIPTREPSDGAE
jgi:uncharacterized oligopeptide transporter (OPT) family protein